MSRIRRIGLPTRGGSIGSAEKRAGAPDLTGSRYHILELLHRYRYLTPRLLALAYSKGTGGATSHVRHELALLNRHGLVERHYDSKRPRGRGSDQYVYALSATGARLALDSVTYSRDRHRIFRRARRERGNYDHHLAISELQLILDLGGDDWTVEDFRSDEREPKSRFAVAISGRRSTQQPDARVTILLASGRQLLYLFEIDLERKSNLRTVQRFEAYGLYLAAKAASGKPPGRAECAEVVFVVTKESELERYLELAIPVLNRWAPRERPPFLFWNMEDWHEWQPMERREAVGTPRERTRKWAVSTLRSPSQILREHQLCDIQGKQRRLVLDEA